VIFATLRPDDITGAPADTRWGIVFVLPHRMREPRPAQADHGRFRRRKTHRLFTFIAQLLQIRIDSPG
jgi:hypothetical protein